MAIKSGTTLLLLTNSAQVEDLVDVSISLSKQTIDITSKDSSYWRELLHGTRSATITANAFVDYAATEGFDELISDFATNTDVTFEISTNVSGDSNITGSGILASIDKTGALDDAMRYTFTIEVNGALTFGTEV
jgi:predicted secreted protein